MASPWVNAVFANEIRKLDQKFAKPGILLKQRASFVSMFVTTMSRLIPSKGISKQRKSVVGRFANPK